MEENNLATTLEKKGSDLFVENQKLTRHQTTEMISMMCTMVLGLIAVVFPLLIPNEIQVGDEIRNIIIFFAVLCFIIFIVEAIRSAKISKKISGSDESFLYAYSAYLALEAYLDPIRYESKLKHFERAIDELDNLGYSISVGWRTFARYNEILPYLDANMETFVNSIIGLKKALKNKTHEIIEIQVTLIELMEFLNDDKKNKFRKINNELKKYNFSNPKINAKQKMKGFFRDAKNQKHIVWIIGLSAIGISPGIVILVIIPTWTPTAITISGSLVSMLIGGYVAPLLKKISTNE